MKKECDDGNIDHKHKNSCRTWMPVYFADFQWNERTGDDCAEPNGPTLRQPKSDSLGQEERRVKQAADSEILNPIRGKGSRFDNNVTNVTAARIEAESCNPLFHEGRYVGMNQPQSADTNSNQKCRFEQLELRYEPD